MPDGIKWLIAEAMREPEFDPENEGEFRAYMEWCRGYEGWGDVTVTAADRAYRKGVRDRCRGHSWNVRYWPRQHTGSFRHGWHDADVALEDCRAVPVCNRKGVSAGKD